MSYVLVINLLKAKITTAIATGVNNAADKALIDVTTHVHRKTGRLSDSYAVTRRATPEELTAVVSSNVSYRFNQYPYLNKTRVNNPPPLLATGKFQGVAFREVVKAIKEEFIG